LRRDGDGVAVGRRGSGIMALEIRRVGVRAMQAVPQASGTTR